MRPKTTAMQRTSDMEGGGSGGSGGFGKSKAPQPPASKHCTTITVTANGQRSPDSPSLSQVSNRRSVEMTDGQRPLRTPSVKSSPAPTPPMPASPSTSQSPTHVLPRSSPAATVNGHSRRDGSDGSSSISSLSGGSGSGSVHAETDFYSSLPDLLPEEVILPPSSSSFQHSLPPSPATSGYCSPLPSPETGSSAGRRSLGRQQQQQQQSDGQDTLSNSSFSNNEAEEDDVPPVLLPPPAQFGDDEGVDDNNDNAQDDDDHHSHGGRSPRTRQSSPPSPPLDYVQPETREGLRSGKSRPFSETEVAHRHRAEAPASATLAYPSSVSSSASPSSSSSSKSSALTRTVSCPVPDALPKEVFHMHVRTTATAALGVVPENHAEVVMDPQRAFAGRRDVRDLQHMQEKEIVSLRGSVRGFKNRVRAGISTFIDTRTSKFNYLEIEKGKIVVYTTSMTVVRETYDRCKVARNILQTQMVRYEERDLYMSHEHQRQLSERMDVDHSMAVRLPQIFIDGNHVGGATELEKLNETGELRQILDSFPKIQVRTMCSSCGGYRYVPCVVCHGSKKSVHRNNFTAEFCALRCMHCNENGLQRCQSCLDQQE